MNRPSSGRYSYIDPTEVASDRTIRVGEVLGSTLAMLRSRISTELPRLSTCWQKVAGDEVSRETTVVSWKAGILTIGTRSSSHLQEYSLQPRRDWEKKWTLLFPELPVDRIKLILLRRRRHHGQA